MPYAEYARRLAPLETFAAEAFQADETTPQALCDFILSLAVVHNDLKDIYIAHALLTETRPEGDPSERPDWGQYAGLRVHLHRVQAGLIDEFLGLVRKNLALLDEPGFVKVRASLSKDDRALWDGIVEVAVGKPAAGSPARALALVRNKVAYHYDASEIGKAYASCFLGANNERRPLLSRGASLGATRFYFADAAADAYLFALDDTQEAREILRDPTTLMDAMKVTLFNIVTGFIQSRGFGWREFGPQP